MSGHVSRARRLLSGRCVILLMSAGTAPTPAVRSDRAVRVDRDEQACIQRSVGAAGYRDAVEPLLSIETVHGLLPVDDLVERCRAADTLVLPYRSITHSGQLELARDLGSAPSFLTSHGVRPTS